MDVPLIDLRAAFLPIRERLLKEFESILDGMNLFLGPNVQAFEREFSDYCEAANGVGLGSGTDALLAALLACEIGPGDEVIVPSHTFFATVEAIIHAGATPVMVDVEPNRMTIDPEEVKKALTSATKAIIPVHLYGHPADMDSIMALALERKLRVIEDCAQAHGARYRGKRCGSIGDVGCFSFYVTKNLGAYGEAGFVTTRDGALAERIRLYRHHGHETKFSHVLIGYNWRMDELQAATLRLKLGHLDDNNKRRRAIAHRYDQALADVGITLPSAGADAEPVYHLYPIRLEERDALQDHLARHGVGTGIHYKIPAHQQPALARHAHRRGTMKVTEKVCAQLLSIPIYPEMEEAQIDHVVSAIKAFLGRG